MNKGFLLALGAAAVSGFSVYLNKFAAGQADPVLFTLLKNSVAAGAILLAILLFSGKDSLKEARSAARKSPAALAAVALFGGGLAFVLFFKGLAITSAVSANVMHKSMFLAVLPLSILILGKKPKAREFLISLALLAGNILFWNLANLSLNPGDLLVLAATGIWAAEAVIAEKLLASIPARTLAFARLAGGLPAILAYLLLFQRTDWSLALAGSGWIFLTGALLAAYVFLYFSAVKEAGAFRTTAALAAAPVLTFLLSKGIPAFSLAQALGAAAILGAIAYLGFSVSERWERTDA